VLLLHLAALAAFAVLVPLGAALLLRRWAAASARARARRELDRLRALEKAGDVVLVKGRLVVEGALEGDARLGRELGAVTTCSTASRLRYVAPEVEYNERAARLDVEVDQRRYELVGDVEVVSGSTVLLTGERPALGEGTAFLTRTAVRHGDAVAVAGVVTDGEEGRDYRGLGPAQIRPSTDVGTLRVVSTAGPRVHVRWRAAFRHGALVPIGLVGLLPALFATVDAASHDCAYACKAYGECETASRFATRPLDEALGDAARGRHFECSAEGDADCRASGACERLGRCAAVGGRCVATDPTDCHRTRMCRDLGRCTPMDGECSVVGSEDCALTDACTDLGWCAAAGGACRELSDEGCRRTAECRASGLCFAGEARCVAKLDEDCAATAACIQDGRCSAVDGRCAAGTRADCERTRDCREKGACTPVAGDCRVARGLADRSADCVASERCAADRDCKLVETENAARCAADAPACRDSDACRVHGRCSGDEVCRAETDSDCAGSTLCKEAGRCRAISGACVKICAETTECREYGRCTEENHACVVGGDEDCRRSLGCSERGGCSAVDGSCVLASSQDCAATRACRDHGWCTVAGADCLPSDADCRASEACKKLGRCSLDKGYRCSVWTDADCAGSEVCTKYGWCSALKKRYSSELECFARRAPAQKIP
jgi:hypothetical protein